MFIRHSVTSDDMKIVKSFNKLEEKDAMTYYKAGKKKDYEASNGAAKHEVITTENG